MIWSLRRCSPHQEKLWEGLALYWLMMVHDFKIHSSWVSQAGPIRARAFVVADSWFSCFLLWKDAKSNIKGISINVCHFCSLRVQEEYNPNSLECHVECLIFFHFSGLKSWSNQYLGNCLRSMILTCTSFSKKILWLLRWLQYTFMFSWILFHTRLLSRKCTSLSISCSWFRTSDVHCSDGGACFYRWTVRP